MQPHLSVHVTHDRLLSAFAFISWPPTTTMDMAREVASSVNAWLAARPSFSLVPALLSQPHQAQCLCKQPLHYETSQNRWPSHYPYKSNLGT